MNPTEFLASIQEVVHALRYAVEVSDVGVNEERILDWFRNAQGKASLVDHFLTLIEDWKRDQVIKALRLAKLASEDPDVRVRLGQPFEVLIHKLGPAPHRTVNAANFPVVITESSIICHPFTLGFPAGLEEVVGYMRTAGYRPATVYELLCWLDTNMISNYYGINCALGQVHDGQVLVALTYPTSLSFELVPHKVRFEPKSKFLGVYVGRTDPVDF